MGPAKRRHAVAALVFLSAASWIYLVESASLQSNSSQAVEAIQAQSQQAPSSAPAAGPAPAEPQPPPLASLQEQPPVTGASSSGNPATGSAETAGPGPAPAPAQALPQATPEQATGDGQISESKPESSAREEEPAQLVKPDTATQKPEPPAGLETQTKAELEARPESPADQKSEQEPRPEPGPGAQSKPEAQMEPETGPAGPGPEQAEPEPKTDAAPEPGPGPGPESADAGSVATEAKGESVADGYGEDEPAAAGASRDEPAGAKSGETGANELPTGSISRGPVEAAETEEAALEYGEQEDYPDYRLDAASCRDAPQAELNETIRSILGTLMGCSAESRLKLRPATNALIANHVMEAGSMPLDLGRLIRGQRSQVSCLAPSQAGKLRLRFDQELADQWLSSRWRLYPRLRLDELPVEMVRSPMAAGGSAPTTGRRLARRPSAGGPSATSKCQKFKVESGQFYLELMSFKTSSFYEAELAQTVRPNGTEADGASSAPSVRLIEFKVRQLFLDHGLKLDGDGPIEAGIGRRPQTVQILHSRNDHYRRNNWLLDLFGNWLKHEYRGQLARLLVPAGGQLSEQLGACFR